jgi:hypothetical protein
VKKISKGRVSSLKLKDPAGVTFFNGSLYTTSETSRIFRGENFEPLAGTGAAGHRDGPLLQARFSRPCALAVANEQLYISDKWNHCIRRISIFVEWSPSNHQHAHKWTKEAVRALALLMGRRDTVWNRVPMDVLFLIVAQLHRLYWASLEERSVTH